MQNQLPGNFPFSHSFHCFSPRLINSLKRPRFCCCLVPCPPPPPVSMTAATGLRWQGGGGCNSCSHIQSFYLSQGLPLQGQERRPQLLGAKHEAFPKVSKASPRAELTEGISRVCGSSQRSVLGLQISGPLALGSCGVHTEHSAGSTLLCCRNGSFHHNQSMAEK